MARKKNAPIGSPQVSPEKGMELLRGQIDKGEELLTSNLIEKDAYASWELLTKNLLTKTFGENSPNIASITSVGKYGSFPMNADPSWWNEHRRQSLRTQLTKLGGLVELLETECDLEASGTVRPSSEVSGNGVFLVHGHNEAVLHETARYLERLNLQVTVLREQPNAGRTIIEKFEDYSDVGFAVVLLTDDDVGGTISSKQDDHRPRARQNVIFEFGYFIGRLGRNRVCALYSEGVEMPSDYSGVIYIPLDEKGAWRMLLAKEMRAANIPVDMNLAL